MLLKVPSLRPTAIFYYLFNKSNCRLVPLTGFVVSELSLHPTHAFTTLKMNNSYKNIMAAILKLRLSEEAVLQINRDRKGKQVNKPGSRLKNNVLVHLCR